MVHTCVLMLHSRGRVRCFLPGLKIPRFGIDFQFSRLFNFELPACSAAQDYASIAWDTVLPMRSKDRAAHQCASQLFDGRLGKRRYNRAQKKRMLPHITIRLPKRWPWPVAMAMHIVNSRLVALQSLMLFHSQTHLATS